MTDKVEINNPYGSDDHETKEFVLDTKMFSGSTPLENLVVPEFESALHDHYIAPSPEIQTSNIAFRNRWQTDDFHTYAVSNDISDEGMRMLETLIDRMSTLQQLKNSLRTSPPQNDDGGATLLTMGDAIEKEERELIILASKLAYQENLVEYDTTTDDTVSALPRELRWQAQFNFTPEQQKDFESLMEKRSPVETLTVALNNDNNKATMDFMVAQSYTRPSPSNQAATESFDTKVAISSVTSGKTPDLIPNRENLYHYLKEQQSILTDHTTLNEAYETAFLASPAWQSFVSDNEDIANKIHNEWNENHPTLSQPTQTFDYGIHEIATATLQYVTRAITLAQLHDTIAIVTGRKSFDVETRKKIWAIAFTVIVKYLQYHDQELTETMTHYRLSSSYLDRYDEAQQYFQSLTQLEDPTIPPPLVKKQPDDTVASQARATLAIPESVPEALKAWPRYQNFLTTLPKEAEVKIEVIKKESTPIQEEDNASKKKSKMEKKKRIRTQPSVIHDRHQPAPKHLLDSVDDEILTEEVRAAIDQAFLESNDGAKQKHQLHEQGGWIYDNDPALDKVDYEVLRWPQGDHNSIAFGKTIPSGTLAYFHTHPYTKDTTIPHMPSAGDADNAGYISDSEGNLFYSYVRDRISLFRVLPEPITSQPSKNNVVAVTKVPVTAVPGKTETSFRSSKYWQSSEIHWQDAVQRYVVGEISEREFDRELGIVLTRLTDLAKLNELRDDLVTHQKDLEREALTYLRPWQADQVINRLRYVEFSLDREWRCRDLKEKEKQQSARVFVNTELEKWFDALPLGWPEIDGSSARYQVVSDKNYYPDPDFFLTREEFKLLFTDNQTPSHQSVMALNHFLLNYQYGYYKFFCFNDYVTTAVIPHKNKDPEYDVSTTQRSQNVLTQLAAVLEKMAVGLSERLATTTDEAEKNEIMRMSEVVNGLRLRLGDFLRTPSVDHGWVISYDNEIREIVPHTVFANAPTVRWQDSETEATTRTQDYLRDLEESKWDYPVDLGREYRLSHILDESQPEYELATQQLRLYENIVPLLGKPKEDSEQDFFASLEGEEVPYALGHLRERAQNIPVSTQQKRIKKLQSLYVNLGISDTAKVIVILQDEGAVSNWRRDGNKQISPQGLRYLQGIQISEDESLWLAAYLNAMLSANKYGLKNDDSGFISPRYERMQHIENVVLHFTATEARALLAKNILSQNASTKNQSHLANRLHPYGSQFIFEFGDDYQNYYRLYALTLISGELFNTPDSLARADLVAQIRQVAPDSKLDQIETKIKMMSYDEKKFYYKNNYPFLLPNYSTLANKALALSNSSFITEDTTVTSSLTPVLQLLQTMIDKPNSYKMDSPEFKSILTTEVDNAVTRFLGVTTPMPRGSEYALRHLIRRVREMLTQQYPVENSNTKITRAFHLLQTVDEILFEPFDLEDANSVATHSKYNRHGYHKFQVPIARQGLDRVFSTFTFNETRTNSGLLRIADPQDLSEIKFIFENMKWRFNYSETLYPFKVRNHTWVKCRNLKMIIESFPEIKKLMIATKKSDPKFIPELSESELQLKLNDVEQWLDQEYIDLAFEAAQKANDNENNTTIAK